MWNDIIYVLYYMGAYSTRYWIVKIKFQMQTGGFFTFEGGKCCWRWANKLLLDEKENWIKNS